MRSNSFTIKPLSRDKRNYTPSSAMSDFSSSSRYSSTSNISRANSITGRSSVTRNSMIFPSSDYRPLPSKNISSIQRSSSFCAFPVTNRDHAILRSQALADDMNRDSNASHENFERRVEAFQKTSRALNKALRDSEVRDMTPEEKAKKLQREQMAVEGRRSSSGRISSHEGFSSLELWT